MKATASSSIESTAPTISIVVASLNQGRWIADCLDSIVRQLAARDELIVVDGGSSDGTASVLARYRDCFSELIVEPDEGQADALRKGFALASGDICAYLNTDDMLLPGSLDVVRNVFTRTSAVQAIYSHRVYIDEEGKPFKLWIIPFHSNFFQERWDYIPQETCFWRRSLMEHVGGIDADFDFAMDYDLFIRMMRAGRFKRIHRFLACFREHPSSKTTTLYDTVGIEEIGRIFALYGIRKNRLHAVLGGLYGQLVLSLGKIVAPIALSRIKRNL